MRCVTVRLEIHKYWRWRWCNLLTSNWRASLCGHVVNLRAASASRSYQSWYDDTKDQNKRGLLRESIICYISHSVYCKSKPPRCGILSVTRCIVLCQRPRSESPRTRPRDVTEARFLEAKAGGMRRRPRPETCRQGRWVLQRADFLRPTPRPGSPSTMPRTRPTSVKNARFLEAEAQTRELLRLLC